MKTNSKYSLKDAIATFLEAHYKNKCTKISATTALNRIKDLEVIDIDKINQIMDLAKISNASKITQLGYIVKFIKFRSQVDGVFYDTTRLNKYETDAKPKVVYTKEELNYLLKMLDKFGNPQFKLIFELMLYNGCRLSEFTSISWNNMKAKNFKCDIKTKKGGRSRIFVIPNHLIPTFLEIGVDYKYNTIQNLFANFANFVRDNNPSWTKAITSHCMRRQRITDMFLGGMSADEIQVVTGHAQINTISQYYIKASAAKMEQLLTLGNLDPVESCEINKLKTWMNTQNAQLIMKDDEINQLKKKLEANERELFLLKQEKGMPTNETEDAYKQTTENEYQTVTIKNKAQDLQRMKEAVSDHILKELKILNESK